MPRSLVGRLFAILLLLLAAALASGVVMVALFQQSAAARVGQASAVAAQSCGAIARAYRFAAAGRTGPPADLDDPALRRDLDGAVAAALARAEEVEGGLWQVEAGPLAYAFPTYEGGTPKTDVPRAELPRIRDAAAAALSSDRPEMARYAGGSATLIVASCPVMAGFVPRLSAWTMTRVHSYGGATTAQLAAGLATLALAVVGASVLAALLVLTWTRHVGRIERAFAAPAGGELPRLPLTGERELDRIVSAANEAGARLARAREETRALSRQVSEGERLAAVGRVAAGVAHEIRNPIAAMRLKAESALRGGDERRIQALHLVIAQVDRLDGLVGRMLAAAERDPPRPEDVPLLPLLRDAAEAAAEAARAAGAAVAVDCAAELVGRFDRAQMRRALDNLVSNALEAGARSVTLKAERAGGRLAITVADDGPGVPEALAATLFDPFVTGRPEGAGLGLSIVREVARAHGGAASAMREGGLTSFRIDVPCPAS